MSRLSGFAEAPAAATQIESWALWFWREQHRHEKGFKGVV